MATQKGRTSKMQIYEAAKKLFYEKGYLDTTIKEIADSADAKVGTVTYYYHKKEEFFYEIYQELIGNIYAFVDKYADTPLSTVQKFMFFFRVFYDVISNDPANEKMVYEFLDNKSLDYYFEEPLTTLVNEVIKTQHDITSQEELELFSIAYFGIQRQLMTYYLERKDRVRYETFLSVIFRSTGSFFGLSRKEINETVLDMERFIQKNDVTEVKFLV
ncbi:TetR/AcrR family transcriptional regulator [Eubacterium sp. 1001713B170207_170306_E7]|uniref:TetR/AcrR family transcriptional regulator n=1 Tax=Eubacterium sp. 1001713B170207_170306_E7 TaxID=2787097 RepID=UPI00189B6F86|nr:TetR/AcrR family transcriptional regulator [Eubacterium sp. 1001713B170207_170306_E7]